MTPIPTATMLQGCLLSLFSALFYGMLGIFAKLAYAAGMNEYQVLLARFICGSALLLAWIGARNPRQLRLPPRTLLKAALLGLVVFTAQSLCFFKAIKTIPVSTAILILYAYPVLVTLLSAVFFRMRVDRVVVLSLTLVSAGFCLVFYDAFFVRDLDPAGLAFMVAATLLFSCYLTISQHVLKGAPPLGVVFYLLVFTGLGFAVVSLLAAGDPASLLRLNATQALLALALGLVPTALAISMLFLAIEKIGSAYASIFSSLEPVATLVAANLILAEPIVAWQVGGTACILGGIVLPNLQAARRKRRLETSPTS